MLLKKSTILISMLQEFLEGGLGLYLKYWLNCMKISAKGAQKLNVLSRLGNYSCLWYIAEFSFWACTWIISHNNFHIVVFISFSRERWLLYSSVTLCSKRNYWSFFDSKHWDTWSGKSSPCCTDCLPENFRMCLMQTQETAGRRDSGIMLKIFYLPLDEFILFTQMWSGVTLGYFEVIVPFNR